MTPLAERMARLGIASQTELARRAGLGVTRVNAFATRRQPPGRQDGGWRDGVEEIAGVLLCDPEDLFEAPAASPRRGAVTPLLDMVPLAEALDVPDPDDMEAAVWAKIEAKRMLAILKPRERRVVEARLDGASLEEAGQEAAGGVTRERVRQIEQKAYRRMYGEAYRTDADLRRRVALASRRFVPKPAQPKPPPGPTFLERYDAERRDAERQKALLARYEAAFQPVVVPYPAAPRAAEVAENAALAKRMRIQLRALAKRYPDDVLGDYPADVSEPHEIWLPPPPENYLGKGD